MLNDSDRVKLRKVFSEICAGFSIYRLNNKTVYIKHFSVIDNLEIDYYYDTSYKEFISRGILTEQEKLDFLIKNGLWLSKDEELIKNTREVLRDLYQSKRKVYKLSDITFYSEEIRKNEEYLGGLLNKKYELIGDTAESEAQKKSDLLLIQKSFFSDQSLKTPLYSTDQFEYLSIHETNKLFDLYQTVNSDVSDNTIRKISVQRFFHDLFFLSENVKDFFGECISKLTHHQVKLLTYGHHFKNILQNANVPDDILDSPDDIENWYYGKQSIENVINRQEQEGGVISLVGVSKKELERYGLDAPVDHNEKIHKQVEMSTNKELTLEESIKLGLIT